MIQKAKSARFAVKRNNSRKHQHRQPPPSWEPIGILPTPQSDAASSDEEVKTNPIVIVLIVAAAVTVIGGTTLVLIKKKK